MAAALDVKVACVKRVSFEIVNAMPHYVVFAGIWMARKHAFLLATDALCHVSAGRQFLGRLAREQHV